MRAMGWSIPNRDGSLSSTDESSTYRDDRDYRS